MIWSLLCSIGQRVVGHCGGGPKGKVLGLVSPLFLWSEWAHSLWWRAEKQGRWSGLASIPLVAVC
jgi:hypothetical protein